MGNCHVAQLNDNLVIAYWFPGFEEYSGFSILGTKNVDETVATVLDYLKENGEPARLVHVPEFVTSNLRFPELYNFTPERDYDECILAVADMSSLKNLIQHKRWKVRRFLTEVEEERVSVKSLDLELPHNRQLLLDAADSWPKKGVNNICKRDADMLEFALRHTEALSIENVCIFIDGTLHSFFLYERSADQKYAILHSGRVSYAIPHIFELVAYKQNQYFQELGIEYVNIKCDLGIPRLRTNKLSLKPADFFRKYTITPKS